MATDPLDRLVRLLERCVEEDRMERQRERQCKRQEKKHREVSAEWEKTKDAFLANYRKRPGGTIHKHRPIRANNC